MKHTIKYLSGPALLLLASCAKPDPEFEAYKAQKEAEAQAQQAAAAAAINSGVPTGYDPIAQPNLPGQDFGVPTSGGITGPMDDSQLQSIPPIPGAGGTINQPLEITGGPIQNAALPNFTGNSYNHSVVSGDTLWGLSRKYNTSVADIKAANGLTSDTIVIGQQISIPNQ